VWGTELVAGHMLQGMWVLTHEHEAFVNPLEVAHEYKRQKGFPWVQVHRVL